MSLSCSFHLTSVSLSFFVLKRCRTRHYLCHISNIKGITVGTYLHSVEKFHIFSSVYFNMDLREYKASGLPQTHSHTLDHKHVYSFGCRHGFIMICIFLEMAKAVLADVQSDDLTDHVFLQERSCSRES